jgi:prevent-host-death family protein
MSEEIGSYEAKTKLPEILRRVESEETFTITNRGKPVADVIASRFNNIKTKMAIANILKTKKQHITDDELAALKDTGRRK